MRRSMIFVIALLFLPQSTPFASELEWKSELLRDHPLVGKIYDLSAKAFVSEAELFAKLAAKTDVLLGETHDNADHHVLQARVIDALVARGKRPNIVLEMIPTKKSEALSKATGRLNWTPEDVANATKWNETGWPAFENYRPIFLAARAANLKLVPGGMGDKDKDLATGLVEKKPLPETLLAALQEELKTSHCGVLPDAVIPKIALVQKRRDAYLAFALLVQRTSTSGVFGDAVMIAGSGHTRKDRGAPHYFPVNETQNPNNIVTVNFREVAAGKTDPHDLFEPGEADYIWFTPRHEREDPCIALRKQFGKAKAQ